MTRRLKLLLDENLGLKVFEQLRKEGLTVQSVLLECRGCEDAKIIEMTKHHDKVIATMDKDFGYLAISQNPTVRSIWFFGSPISPNHPQEIAKAMMSQVQNLTLNVIHSKSLEAATATEWWN